jgi:hypothetical protein
VSGIGNNDEEAVGCCSNGTEAKMKQRNLISPVLLHNERKLLTLKYSR